MSHSILNVLMLITYYAELCFFPHALCKPAPRTFASCLCTRRQLLHSLQIATTVHKSRNCAEQNSNAAKRHTLLQSGCKRQKCHSCQLALPRQLHLNQNLHLASKLPPLAPLCLGFLAMTACGDVTVAITWTNHPSESLAIRGPV